MVTKIWIVDGKIIPRGTGTGEATTAEEAAEIATLGAKPVGKERWLPTTPEEEAEIREVAKATKLVEEKKIYYVGGRAYYKKTGKPVGWRPREKELPRGLYEPPPEPKWYEKPLEYVEELKETAEVRRIKAREVYEIEKRKPTALLVPEAFRYAALSVGAFGIGIARAPTRFIAEPITTLKGFVEYPIKTVWQPYETTFEVREALRKEPIYGIGEMVGYVGLTYGVTKAIPKGIGYVRTIGRKEIPVAKLIPKGVRIGKKGFPVALKRLHYKIFMEKYAKLPDIKEQIVYHAAPRPLEFPVKKYLFVAPQISPHFLRMAERGLGIGYPTWKGLKTIFQRPKVAAIIPKMIVKGRPKGWRIAYMKPRYRPKGWKGVFGRKGWAYIPRYKPEVEALIPAKTEAALISKQFYFRWKGVRVPIDVYRAVGGLPKVEEITIGKTIGKPTPLGKIAPSYYLPARYPSYAYPYYAYKYYPKYYFKPYKYKPYKAPYYPKYYPTYKPYKAPTYKPYYPLYKAPPYRPYYYRPMEEFKAPPLTKIFRPKYERPRRIRKPYKIPRWQKVRYQPSLIALQYGIYGKPVKGVRLALGVRPAPKWMM